VLFAAAVLLSAVAAVALAGASANEPGTGMFVFYYVKFSPPVE
jgi:hypothetical protein